MLQDSQRFEEFWVTFVAYRIAFDQSNRLVPEQVLLLPQRTHPIHRQVC